MTPTQELRDKFRRYTNEKIPSGGTQEDTNFTDAEIDDILSDSATFYGAVSVGWMIKASFLESELERYSVGDESYQFTSTKDRYDRALKMADKYANMDRDQNQGAFMVKVNKPEVY